MVCVCGLHLQLRKLPWKSDDTIEPLIHDRILATARERYNGIHMACNLLAGLRSYHDSLVVKVVDTVLEAVHRGLETNNYRHSQGRVGAWGCEGCALCGFGLRWLWRDMRCAGDLKLLGELYNYCLLNHEVIFSTLYVAPHRPWLCGCLCGVVWLSVGAAVATAIASLTRLATTGDHGLPQAPAAELRPQDSRPPGCPSCCRRCCSCEAATSTTRRQRRQVGRRRHVWPTSRRPRHAAAATTGASGALHAAHADHPRPEAG